MKLIIANIFIQIIIIIDVITLRRFNFLLYRYSKYIVKLLKK